MTLTGRSEVPRLDVFVTRVENSKTSILVTLDTELSLKSTLNVLKMLLGVDDIGIKSPWIGVDVWLLLFLSWIALEVDDIFVIVTVIGITLWPVLSPVRLLVLHEIILVNTTNVVDVSEMIVVSV